ncbi:hypothetical protein GWI33_002175, partial [Rhynchophorus ferrugineus]
MVWSMQATGTSRYSHNYGQEMGLSVAFLFAIYFSQRQWTLEDCCSPGRPARFRRLPIVVKTEICST